MVQWTVNDSLQKTFRELVGGQTNRMLRPTLSYNSLTLSEEFRNKQSSTFYLHLGPFLQQQRTRENSPCFQSELSFSKSLWCLELSPPPCSSHYRRNLQMTYGVLITVKCRNIHHHCSNKVAI